MATYIFYISSFDGGGAESVFIRIANSLAKRQHKVIYIVDRNEGQLGNQLLKNIKLIVLEESNLLLKVLKVTKILTLTKFNRFFTTLNSPNLVGFFASVLSFTRSKHYARIAAVHSTSIENTVSTKRRALLYVLGCLYKFFGNIICISDYIKEDLINNYAVSKDITFNIYNPQKLRNVAKNSKSHFPLTGKYNVLVVGRLVKQKNIDLIIEAFAAFQKKNKTAHLYILGTGTEINNLQKHAERLLVQNNVTFVGYVLDPSLFFSQCDLFILFSSWEGLPNVVLEALASDINIIISDVPGGGPELLDYGRYGRITTDKNVEELTKNMEEIKQFPMTINKKCKQEFLQRFDLENITDLYEDSIL